MLRALRQRRLLRRTPRTPICKAPRAGTLKVVGKVTSQGPPVLSPVTCTPCAYYELTIDEWILGIAATMVRQTSSKSLSIDDGTGRGVIELDHALVFLTGDGRVTWGLASDAPEVIVRLFNQSGRSAIDEHGLLKGITFRERILLEGDTIAAWGRAEWDVARDDPSLLTAGYRETPERLLVRSPRDGQTLISDDLRAVAG